MSEAELFDRLAGMAGQGPDHLLARQAELAELLAGVSEGDQQIIRLAVVHEMNGEELGRALGVSPGAARVRLHRALNRLRRAHSRRRRGEAVRGGFYG